MRSLFLSGGRHALYGATPFSLIARLTLMRGEAVGSLRLYPIHTRNETNDFQPRFATRQERDRLMPLLYGGRRLQDLPGAVTGVDGFGPYLDLPLGLPRDEEEAQAAQ